MSISSPQSRSDLKEYIKTKLGAPVLQINVSDEQMDIAIDDAFQYFYERQHFDAMEKVYLSVQVSQALCDFFSTGAIEGVTQPSGSEDFKTQNNYLVLPKDVVGVNRILRPQSGIGPIAFGGIPFGALWAGTMFGQGMLGGTNFDLTSYYTMTQYMETIQWTLYPPVSYSFNKRSHRLFLNSNNFAGNSLGDYLVMECDVKVNPDMYDDVWNDMFLKRMSVAYTQLAWGRNLTKFNQVQLPGGITMNGDQIFNEAKEEIQKIEERFAFDYADPVLDIVG